MPGDIETLARWAANKAGANVDPQSLFRTSEGFNESLPFRANESPGRGAWEGAGNMVAPGPLAAVLKGAKYAGPALEALAENMPARAGARASQTGAVRLPGSQWAPGQNPKDLVKSFDEAQQVTLPDDVSKIFQNKVSKYIQQDLATPGDPLRTKELQPANTVNVTRNSDGTIRRKMPIGEPVDTSGTLHMTQKDLNARNAQFGETAARERDWVPVDYADNLNLGFGPGFKQSYSQGDDSRRIYSEAGHVVPDARTGWENLADSHVNMITPDDLMYYSRGPQPAWVHKLPLDTPMARLQGDTIENLGFGNVRNYLKEATAQTPEVGPLSPEQSAVRDLKLQLPASRLNQMTMSDLVNNTGQMVNRADAERLRGNLQSTEKRVALENDQHRISELTPEGLKHETESIGNCVGDGCSYEDSVRSGSSRIYSLRDKKTGEPRVTIEAQHHGVDPDTGELPDVIKNGIWDQVTAEEIPRAEYNQRYLALLADKTAELQANPQWKLAQVRGKDQLNEIPEKYIPTVLDFLNKGDPEGGISQWHGVDPEEFSKGLKNVEQFQGRYMHKDAVEDAMKQFGNIDFSVGGFGGHQYDWPKFRDSRMTDTLAVKKYPDPTEREKQLFSDFKSMLGDTDSSLMKPTIGNLPDGWEKQWWNDRAAKAPS